jgi:hypothetical protein
MRLRRDRVPATCSQLIAIPSSGNVRRASWTVPLRSVTCRLSRLSLKTDAGKLSIVSDGRERLREERQFTKVLVATCAIASGFLLVFVVLTLVKAACTPRDITAGYFSAWGTWAGGLATAAAFLIAAYSVAVASAHAREDRREAARVRENNDMAQARLLTIYKVEIPDSISSLATYRIENRSHDYFFDVTVPFADSPDQSNAGFERRTPELVTSENRLHEFLPNGELLTAYRSH